MALDRIKTIILEEDLAALVIVQDQESAAFINRLDPTWSCITTTKGENPEDGEFVRICSKLVDYPSKEAQKKHIELSAGIIITFLNYTSNLSTNLGGVMRMLADNFAAMTHIEERRDNLSE